MSKTETKAAKSSSPGGEKLKQILVLLVIPVLLVLSFIFFEKVMGDPSHFQGGNPENNPLPGDYFGIVYKGGIVVPFLITLVLTGIVFSIERFITIGRAKGKGNLLVFTKNIKSKVRGGQLDEAIVACDKQEGSVANVVRAGIVKYKEMEGNQSLSHEKKIEAIQQDIEECTQLEMPSMERNLVIISTLVSVSTLIGLLGTVMGMIKAFSALATAGAPDAVGLANGISEALVNTALGILSAALATIMYNTFTTKIDKITYNIDEIGYTIVQEFTRKNVG